MIAIIASALGSFLLFTLISHPNSRINKKLPQKKISRFEIFPRLRFEAKNRVVHVHHWVLFTPAYFAVNHVNVGIDPTILHGFLLGGIVQGMLFEDRFRLVYNAKQSQEVKKSSYNLSFLKKLI